MDKIQEEELFDTLRFIKDKMVTKEELTDAEGRLANRIDNVGRGLDNETDKRKQLEVRVSKVETKIFAK